MEQRQLVLSVLVEDKPGVLARVSLLAGQTRDST